jgi:hypothetical protein
LFNSRCTFFPVRFGRQKRESDPCPDEADELIARHPGFQQTIRQARQQKVRGQVRSLAELRQEYESDEEVD